MRYDVKKFLFVGVEEDRLAFFKRAQEAGIIHFINAQRAQVKEAPESVQKIAKAIKILRGLPPTEQEETEEYEIASGLANKIVALKEQHDKLAEEERIIRLELSRVEAFGDFSQDDIAYVEKEGKRKVQFYVAKQGRAELADLPDEVVHVSSAHALDYFIGINKEQKQYPKMVEMIIDRPWGQLKRREKEIHKEQHDCEGHLKGYAKYNRFLHHALIYSLNDHHLEEASNFVQFPLESGMLFAIEGWVPDHKSDELAHLVKEMNVHVEEIAQDPNEVSPTYLENEGAARIGEDVMRIYDTPSNTDKDPSLWILVFFSLFFAMIIGDGGYGLVLLLVALYIRSKSSKVTRVGRRFFNLVAILCFSIIAWGVLTTSFFGITIPPDSPLRKVSVMSWLVEKKVEYIVKHKDASYQEWVKKFPQLAKVSDPTEFLMTAQTKSANGLVTYDVYNKFADNIMMELALFVGVLHIIFSMLRYIGRNPQNIGWVIFLIGAYLYTPHFLDATSFLNFAFGVNREAAAKNALYLIYGGVALAVVIAIFKHKLLGLLEASVVIQIFGDVLSYLRLYALGLAGSLMTSTMNELAASVPLVFGILILLLGHVVNIALGIMGGVIHGLRLNFLEWYHYSFEGGGKNFNPLRKLDIER